MFIGDVCWKKLPGTKIKGLTNMQFGPHTTCMKYCVGCLICNAMTYDPEADPSCFVQLAKDAGHFDDDSFESSPSATSYILDKGCLGEINFLSE